MKISKHMPNILTAIRIVLIIPIVVLLFGNYQEKIISGSLLFLAGVTDYLDGIIARKYKLSSDLGMFLDPLADKLLIISILIAFLKLDPSIFPYWMVWIIICREFVVTAIRIGGIERNSKVNTLYIGKLKTLSQLLTILLIFILLIMKDYFIGAGVMKQVKGAVEVPFDRIWFNYFGDLAYFITYTPSFLLGISTILSVYSGFRYIIKNKKLIFGSEYEDESNE